MSIIATHTKTDENIAKNVESTCICRSRFLLVLIIRIAQLITSSPRNIINVIINILNKMYPIYIIILPVCPLVRHICLSVDHLVRIFLKIVHFEICCWGLALTIYWYRCCIQYVHVCCLCGCV